MHKPQARLWDVPTCLAISNTCIPRAKCPAALATQSISQLLQGCASGRPRACWLGSPGSRTLLYSFCELPCALLHVPQNYQPSGGRKSDLGRILKLERETTSQLETRTQFHACLASHQLPLLGGSHGNPCVDLQVPLSSWGCANTGLLLLSGLC